MRVYHQRVEQVAEAHVHCAPKRGYRRKADADRRREIEHRGAHRARLRHERKPAGMRDPAADRRVESDAGADDAERMRSEHAKPARVGDGDERFLPTPRFGRVRRRRRQNHHRLDPRARGILEHAAHRRGRCCDHRKVDRLCDCAQRRVRPPRKDATMTGIDDVKRTLESPFDQVLEDDPAHRSRLGRGADDSDRNRGKKRAEIVGFLHAMPPRRPIRIVRARESVARRYNPMRCGTRSPPSATASNPPTAKTAGP